MKIMKKSKDFLLSQPLLSRRRYFWGKVTVITAFVIAVVVFVFTAYYWRSLSWPYRLLLSLCIWVLAPDIYAFRSLRTPYGEYKKQWEEHNASSKST